MKNKFLLLLLVVLIAGFAAHAQIITTIAGGGTAGLGDGGSAVSCELDLPYNTAIDATGNLYIADASNYRIRKVNIVGVITTIAGTGSSGYNGDDIAATTANLGDPIGVAVDASGNVYVADNANHRIRKVNTSGIITTIAGNGVFGYNGDNIAATAATLYSPHGIAVDGGSLYICDVLNNRLRKVDLTTGIITTVAGTGTFIGYGGDGGQATATDIGQPFGVTTDAAGNIFFASMTYNRVCKINTSGIISTIAGTGGEGYNGDNISATTAELKEPFSVAVNNSGDVIIADLYNFRIRKVNSSGIITTIAGTGTEGFSGDGSAAIDAEIGGVTGITTDGNGNLYISDNQNSKIRYIKDILSTNTINKHINDIYVYPNPSNTGNFIVNILSDGDSNAQVVISDLLGKKVKEITTTTNNPLGINLDVPNGIYFLSATTPDETITKKLVIQR